ncbi:energy transducer TonB [uncultured Amaricoccus sp.]|uniref:energy transducer TonB n=1 Tax=uncultured Amaricoccus sp. TaxID=339341 RepID=UPI0026038D8F|nr:energy transducer TonB [uncultured Amaricoccus sp.]
MSAAAFPIAPGDRAAGQRAALWTGAAAFALAAHAGAVAWALRQPPPFAVDPAPAPAVMIDLEPAAVAPQAPVESLATDNLDAPEIEESMPEIAPLAPPPAPPAVPVEPLRAEVPDALPAAEPPPELPVPVTRPAARPRDIALAAAAPAKPVEKVERRAPEPEKASRAQTRARTTAPTAKVAAAPAKAAGASASLSPARWEARLMAHLERRKKYPAGARKRREEGTVLVRFAIDGGGNVLSAGLVRSSGFAELDQAVLALVRGASPVPAPPPGAPHEITAPVRFSIR